MVPSDSAQFLQTDASVGKGCGSSCGCVLLHLNPHLFDLSIFNLARLWYRRVVSGNTQPGIRYTSALYYSQPLSFVLEDRSLIMSSK